HGYRKAYLTLSEELGILRQIAAPIVRNQSPVDPDFFGRIGIWAEQVKQTSKVEKPSIFLVTLPKSATVFVGHSIAQTLEYDITSTLVTPTFPKNIIWGPMLLDFLRGGMVSASHLQPDDTNLTLLKRTGVKQIVLHIRDPRAALLSWAHFVIKAMRKQKKPCHPSFASFDALNNLDVFVNDSFPFFVKWIDQWMSAERESPDLIILWMSHEQLVANPQIYFDKIFSFYGLNPKELKLVEKTESTHFRSGDNSEWRRVFSSDLIKKMNDQISERLWSKFGWSR
ncbi:MAG: sulfotransferase domain-containing protein, partial [Nitrososphaera sp.]